MSRGGVRGVVCRQHAGTRWDSAGRIGSTCIAIFVALLLAGCVALDPLPEANLSDPGWKIWTGQAVWQPRAGNSPLVGDMIVARHADGEIFVSFSKPPLPLLTARANGSSWWIDVVERGHSYSGRGKPPGRFIWFRMPDVLEGSTDIAGWEIEAVAAGEKILTNSRTGERVRMIIDL